MTVRNNWCIVHLANWSPTRGRCDAYVDHYGPCSGRQPRLNRLLAVHGPGEPHRYRIACQDCGQLGTIRLAVEP